MNRKYIDLEIIDNCIPEFYQDYFESAALGQTKGYEIENSLPWTAKYEKTAEEEDVSPLSFKHILKSSAELSPYLADFSRIPQTVVTRLGYALNDIIFARLFLTMPYNTEMTNHAPHTDLNFPHISLIYYVNDSDGDTVFFEPDYKTIYKRVTPKKGRCVVFNGLIPHGAGIPTKNPRCIVNYNLLLS